MEPVDFRQVFKETTGGVGRNAKMVRTYIIQQINDTGHWEDILTTTDPNRARERQEELGQSGRLLEFNSPARTRPAGTTKGCDARSLRARRALNKLSRCADASPDICPGLKSFASTG